MSKVAETPEPKTILLIYSVIEKLDRGEANDLIPDLETPQTAAFIGGGLEQIGCNVVVTPIRSHDNLVAVLGEYDPQHTLVFNLCEGLGGLASGESDAPRVLEQMGFGYTGATAENLDACLDKGLTKSKLLSLGIPTAAFHVFHDLEDEASVPLPAIVKPTAEDCSIGISTRSVVWDTETLRSRVAYIIEKYRQPALVEAYLNGGEYNVSMWGNGTIRALSVAQIDFSNCSPDLPRIDHFTAKWSNTYPAIYPAPISEEFRERIVEVAMRTYHAMGCRDYARVDLREQDDQLFVLDVNPNPSLSSDSGFVRAAALAGYPHPEMARRLVQIAWRRFIRERELAA